MRLITKTTLWYLVLALIVFGLGSLIILSVLREAVQRETDYELLRSWFRIRHELADGRAPEDLENRFTSIRMYPPGVEPGRDSLFRDTLIYHRRTEQQETFRKLIADFEVDGQFYHIESVDIVFEEEDITRVASLIIVRLFIFLSVVLLLGNVLISNRLLRPFQAILKSVRAFNLKNNHSRPLPKTTTDEFVQLNHFLEQMMTKAKRDYTSLKEFSENASHEMQTPLAIAQGKLEILLESPNLNAKQLQLIESARQAIRKLSKLGKALALLSKIENQEFESTTAINFSQVVQETTTHFTELGELQGIRVNSTIQQDVSIRIDPVLADILVTNLLKNALQHNIPKGWVKLQLSPEKLIIENSGLTPKESPQQFFERFRKSDQTKGTLGLGLAIVKEICEGNKLGIEYHFAEGQHHITINLKQESTP